METDHLEASQPEYMTEPFKKKIDADEDFINYMQVFAMQLTEKIQNTKDKDQIQYYRGMLFSLKAVSQVYQTLLNEDYI